MSNTTVPAPQSPASPCQLEKELIAYLSKEIETQTNSMATFRSRISSAGLFGPFLLLASFVVATRALPIAAPVQPLWKALPPALLLVASYVALAIAGARIENHVWTKCNEWRRLIFEISKGRTDQLDASRFHFDESLRLGYTFCYGAIGIAFLSALYLIRFFIPPPTP